MDFGGEPPSAQYFSSKKYGRFFDRLCSRLLRTPMVLILEESEPVVSDDGWSQTVRIDQIELTPKGSRQ
eukprot:2452952-Prymnesium_polylepis.3